MKKTISIISKTILVSAVAFSAMYAMATSPSTPPPTPGNAGTVTSAIINGGDSNQIKTGTLGLGAVNPTLFSTASALGYKVVTDGGASFGPTAVFGSFTATGSAITFSGLPNQKTGLCTDTSGMVVACTPAAGKTCGLKANQPVAVGCPAGAYLVQMSANGVTGTCRWLDTSHAGGTTVPNTKDMCY